MNTSEQHIATRPFLVNLTYFSDQFPPDHTDIIKEFKTLYLMIKAKSRFCKGVNSKKNTDKIHVQDMTIILRYKIAMFNFGAHGFRVNT